MNRAARLGAALAVVALVATATPAAATPYDASCASGAGATSSFTAVKRGWYLYAWRTGTTANGGGVVYLRAGQTMTLDTPLAVSSSSRFGVMTGTSTTYAYIYCS